MRKSGFAAVVVFAVLALTGCTTTPLAVCPAIGWPNTLTVKLEGNTSSVDLVQVCADGECLAPLPRPAPEYAEPGEVRSPNPGGRTESSTPPPEVTSSSLERVESDRWIVHNLNLPNTKVSVRALDSAGKVITEDEFALDWMRVGGSEECGGPMEAGPVTLALP